METLDLSQTARLVRRRGVYHYRRRVPDALVLTIGKREIHRSLGTANLQEAKKRRAVEDVRWDGRFRAAESPESDFALPKLVTGPCNKKLSLAYHEALRLVQGFVTRLDAQEQALALKDPPADARQRSDVFESIETGLGILRDRSDIRSDQWIDNASRAILGGAGVPTDAAALADIGFAEIVRRGLFELERRKLARLDDISGSAFFDAAFDPNKVPDATFAELAQQFLSLTEEEATANGTSKKWVDKQRASAALLSEIIGSHTLIRHVDFDACLRVRGVLARFPVNRSKSYSGLSIDDAVAAAEAGGAAAAIACYPGCLSRDAAGSRRSRPQKASSRC